MDIDTKLSTVGDRLTAVKATRAHGGKSKKRNFAQFQNSHELTDKQLEEELQLQTPTNSKRMKLNVDGSGSKDVAESLASIDLEMKNGQPEQKQAV